MGIMSHSETHGDATAAYPAGLLSILKQPIGKDLTFRVVSTQANELNSARLPGRLLKTC